MALGGVPALVFPYNITLSNAGNSTVGSANEFVDVGEILALPTHSPAPYEKAADIRWATQNDPSDYPGLNVPLGSPQITRDLVGRITVGVLNVDYGRAWANNTYVTKLPGRIGYTNGHEYNLVNDGVDCSDPNDSIRGAFGIWLGPAGSVPQTLLVGMAGAGGPGSHVGLFVQRGAIVSGGALIHSEDDFAIVCQGQRVMWSTIVRALHRLGLA